MKLKTEAAIAQEIADAKANLETLQEKLAERQAMEPAKRLAMDLHEVTCIGRCEWGWGGDWNTDFEMKGHLERATNLLAVTTHEQAMETVRIALGR